MTVEQARSLMGDGVETLSDFEITAWIDAMRLLVRQEIGIIQKRDGLEMTIDIPQNEKCSRPT